MTRSKLRTKTRSKGLWTIAQSKHSYYQYIQKDYKDEGDYINSLSDDEKEWLNDFLLAYYHRNKKAMDKLNFSKDLRRSRYNQHRGVVNDFYSKHVWVDAYEEYERKLERD